MKKNGMKLWHKTILGMVLGIICGIYLKQDAMFLKPIGTMYVNMLKMIVIPIIFFAILYGVTSMDDANTFGRIGFRALILYLISTFAAVLIGIAFGIFFKPGEGVQIPLNESQVSGMNLIKDGGSITNIIVNMIPSNIVEAMANNNTLQVVFFAFFLGFALIAVGEKGYEVKKFIISATSVIFKLVELVIKTTPYGVFAIMACTIGEYGIGLMVSLGKLILVIFGGFATQYILLAPILLLAGLNPLIFYKKMINIQALAVATSSSKATLMTAISDLQKKFGVSKRVSNFVLPLGAAINMTATAIYLGIGALFFAQMTNTPLGPDQYLVIIITSTIGSIGSAGFPGGGVIMMGMVLSSVGLPLGGIPLIMGIDRIIDMIRTMINITGDCAFTIVVDKIEKTLDHNKYKADI